MKALLRNFLFNTVIGIMFVIPNVTYAESYSYDNAGRLTGVTYDDGSSIAYTYDNAGNRLQLTSTTASAPAISVAPITHGFTSIVVGSVSTSQTITISNDGTADLVVSAISLTGADAAEFDVVVGTCASLTPTISAATNCTVTVTFSPASVGTKTAALNITSNDAGTPSLGVALTGQGIAANIVVTPVAHDFGSIVIGSASTSQTITISNDGTADLVISGINLTGADATEFDVATGTCTSLSPTIGAASSCTVTVNFSPASVGAKTAALSITSNDADTPNLDVSLNGRGVAANIAVTPVSLGIGTIDVGSVSSSLTITISNDGTADLVVGAISLTGADATEFGVTVGTCTSLSPTISAASSCTVTVNFSPASAGAKTAALSITSNDVDTPNLDVTLSGTGQALVASLFVTPVTHDFGDVDVGAITTQAVTIENVGITSLSLGDIAIADSLSAPFSLLANDCANSSLAVGGSCILTVQFAPTIAGVANDSFDITSDDPDTLSLTITVTGNGVTVADSNTPPSIPVLLNPAIDATDLDPASIVFDWQPSEDLDLDTISYRFYICEDSTFAGCNAINVASSVVSISVALLGSGSGSFLLIGLIGNNTRRRYYWLLSPKMVTTLAAIILMTSCGGDSGGGNDNNDPVPTVTPVSHTETGLLPATTYYWKVSADDGNGGVVESEVQSFTTQ